MIFLFQKVLIFRNHPTSHCHSIHYIITISLFSLRFLRSLRYFRSFRLEKKRNRGFSRICRFSRCCRLCLSLENSFMFGWEVFERPPAIRRNGFKAMACDVVMAWATEATRFCSLVIGASPSGSNLLLKFSLLTGSVVLMFVVVQIVNNRSFPIVEKRSKLLPGALSLRIAFTTGRVSRCCWWWPVQWWLLLRYT